MSRCIYKSIADNLNKQELENYYQTHLPKDVCKHFGFEQKYFIRVFDYLGIRRRNASENTVIQFRYYDNSERNRKCGEAHKGLHPSQETIEKIRKSNQGKKRSVETRLKVSQGMTGHTPWNKGLKGAQHWTPSQKEQYLKTLKNNGMFKHSKVEEEYYNYLLSMYDAEDIIRQYSTDERYPFACDFYIKSEDKFIEVNRFWHHGPHPFDINNPEDLNLLEKWKSKADGNNQYDAAIYTWTVRDVNKINIAIHNKLNYEMIY